jgi:hypothetical protein
MFSVRLMAFKKNVKYLTILPIKKLIILTIRALPMLITPINEKYVKDVSRFDSLADLSNESLK